MRTFLLAAAAIAMAGPALAQQGFYMTQPTDPLLPTVLYEVDYANHGPLVNAKGNVDTVISIGIPYTALSRACTLQVAWFDWNSTAPIAWSGPVAVPGPTGTTVEFTSSNTGSQNEYAPFTENVFSNVPQGTSFEGYAQVRTDAKCKPTEKLRVDAEFVTATAQPNPIPTLYSYKSINVTNVKGVTGY